MDVLKKRFKHVKTLREFFIDEKIDVQKIAGELKTAARPTFFEILDLIIAYDYFSDRDDKLGQAKPFYNSWLLSAMARTNRAVNGSLQFFKNEIWAAIDSKITRKRTQWIVEDSCLFTFVANSPGTIIQLTGDKHAMEKGVSAIETKRCSKTPSKSPLIDQSRREMYEILSSLRDGSDQRQRLPKSVYRAHLTRISFVVPLSFGKPFPPTLDIFKKSNKSLTVPRNLRALPKLLKTVEEKLSSGIVHKKFQMIRIKSDHIIKHHIIVDYCISCLRYLFPRYTFGSDYNWTLLKTKIHQFVELRSQTSISIEELARKFKVSDTWLGKSCSGQEAAEKNTIFRQFIYWIFVLVKQEMMSKFIYLSTKSPDQNLVYFKRHGWCRVRRDRMSLYKKSLKIASQEMGIKSIPKPFLVPKKKPGQFRFVLNLSYLKRELEDVSAVLSLLSHQALETPLLKSRGDASAHIIKYMHNYPPNTKFHVVSTDITGCYDNANSTTVLNIVQEIMAHSSFDNHVFNTFKVQGDKLKGPLPRPLKVAQRISPSPIPWRTVFSLEIPRRDVILAEISDGRRTDAKGVYRAVDNILHHLPVQVGDHVYEISGGIPQGSPISAQLCHLLCQEFIRTELAKFWADPNGLLLRFFDDFLYITTEEKMALRFQRKIRQDYPLYGISFSVGKTTSNFGENPVEQIEFLGIPVSHGAKLSPFPRLNLRDLTNAIKRTSDSRFITVSESNSRKTCLSPVLLDSIPFNLSRYSPAPNYTIQKKRRGRIVNEKPRPTWLKGRPVTVFVETIIRDELAKLAAVVRTFTRNETKVPCPYVEKAVDLSISAVCKVLVALGVEIKLSRKFMRHHLTLFMTRSGLRKVHPELQSKAMAIWFKHYKDISTKNSRSM